MRLAPNAFTFLLSMTILLGHLDLAWSQSLGDGPAGASDKIIGMYVHQHWPYNHPYAARTWTENDWVGYAEGLQHLGFNTIKIWVVLETMPEPMTDSDVAYLKKIGRVIDALHERGMKVIVTLCPNVTSNSAVAKLSSYEDRYFFYCDLRVDPGNERDVQEMIRRREKQLRPLAQVDAITIIDSDPGGYPGSTNKEFVNLFLEHRKMLDRIRPGIELIYWMHAGWEGYGRYYATSEFAMGKESEYLEILESLKEHNPEPWGVASHIEKSKKAGLLDRAIDYRYGAIEGEPSFPLTNFGDSWAYDAAQGTSGRGVMGNAQTHCLQLPNTFAFGRGAQGLELTENDYIQFANDLIPGHGELIFAGWNSLWQGTSEQKREIANQLENLAKQDLKTGKLKGLLFGDPSRFLVDIACQLRLHAACNDFCDASESTEDVSKSYQVFADAFSTWQKRHGYEGRVKWRWKRLDAALDRLGVASINAPRRLEPYAKNPFAKVKEDYSWAETATSRLTDAFVEHAKTLNHNEKGN